MSAQINDIHSCRGCNQNLAGNDPASQYQRQKIIQNTVRVASSLYTMSLASLSSYQKPSSVYQMIEQSGTPYVAPPTVYWNQMSDRASPGNQVVKTASGSAYRGSSTHHTIVRNRPGAMSPGGVGVDIKHNSYERRLNKLKGKKVLRQGLIPTNYGSYIPFNRAYPVYGGKTIKTSLNNGCDCVNNGKKVIYSSSLNAIQDKILSVGYNFNVGDNVWAKKYDNDTKLYKAQIKSILNGVYTIQFMDDLTVHQTSVYGLLIYFDCNCSSSFSIEEQILENAYPDVNVNGLYGSYSELACYMLNKLQQN